MAGLRSIISLKPFFLVVEVDLAEAKAKVEKRVKRLEHELKVLKKTLRWLKEAEGDVRAM